MGKFVFKGENLEKVLNKASLELNIPSNELNYKVVNEKHGIFKKSIEIEVEVAEEVQVDQVEIAKEEKEVISEFDGAVRIEDGVIHVRDPKENGKPAEIFISNYLECFIDGKEVSGRTRVFENNKIEFVIGEQKSKRNIDIKIDQDAMEAKISISYIPEIKYAIKDAEETMLLDVQLEEKEIQFPPKFSVDDIKTILREKNVVFGLIEENIKEASTLEKVEEMEVAKGIPVKNDIPDELKIYFSESNQSRGEDDLSRVDYKNFYSIANIKTEEILAEIFNGEDGTNGTNIFGKELKRKIAGKLNIKTGEGCKLEDNKIIATTEGRPCLKSGVFQVNKVLMQDIDVDMKSGNISFIGDIHIKGEVKDGMRVDAGNTLIVEKNVSTSTLVARGDILIKGNCIGSTIIAGGDNTVVVNEMTLLGGIKEDLCALIEAVVQVKERNLFGKGLKDGEIIRLLLDKKFKRLLTKSIIYLRDTNKEELQNDKLKFFLKNNIFGLGATNIKSHTELYNIIDLIDAKNEILKSQVKLPVNLTLAYAQDCRIQASGDIIFSGTGSYLSHVEALGEIHFKGNNSVVRGGVIKSEKEIRCKIVGSEGGGKTQLITGKKGHIYADVAYIGTCLLFGLREYVFEEDSKNVHAYLDEDNELIVEKFVL
ncbi:DUF342 domain-containing protein [Clostridium sp. YIM B02551]|uniref:DUF342 domain-containing protein n=1 Tax=Clostridium sp. YIM B02551 TaxID=2910679 RepID=UPI001EEAC39B|nr:FapA family protein [Clostridium sp. YIM B02551]